jgi:ABC-type transport system substrate-binding protein
MIDNKMKRKGTSTVLMLLFLMLATFQFPSVHAESQKGPRTDDVHIYFYSSLELCYTAFTLGEIDVVASPITKPMYDNCIEDDNVVLAPYTSSYEMRGFNLNINGTIKTYKDVGSPLNDTMFRKALAFLVDKGYIVDAVFEGFAERIDVPFPASQSDWWNMSVCYPNYPYEYNFDQACAILDQAGFIDRDNDSVRNYPIGWPKREDGPNLDPIIFCVDSTDLQRIAMGDSLRDEMLAAGIPVNFLTESPTLLFERIMVDHDYHIYVGSQPSYRFPFWWYLTAILVFTYASSGQQWTYAKLWEHWDEYGYVQDRIYDTGLGSLLEEILTAPSFQEALKYTKKAQGVYVENVFEIPVCSIRSFFAYCKNLVGTVNEEGFGIDNPYTFLNTYRTDDPDQPIRVGLVNVPIKLNPLYSLNQHDWKCLDKIYAGLLSYNPYDLSIDQPWVAQDWDAGTWLDPDDGMNKTVIDYWFRKDVYWVKPVTGEADGRFTAKDYEFTCHYIYDQFPCVPTLSVGCPHLDKFENIYNVTIIDDFHVRVYMNVSSMWAYLWPTYPLLPKHVWLKDSLAYEEEAYFEVNSNITLPSIVPLDHHVVSGSEDTQIEVQLIDGGEGNLTWGKDFTWKGGNLYIKIDSVNGVEIDKVWLDYWRNGDANGYYPGGLPWQQVLEGCGTHYVVNISPGEGFVCDANRHFFLETPPLGEIDWRWKWAGSKPRSGYYKIDIYDVTVVCGAYGSTGTGIPDPNWSPGADLAPEGGEINIYDVNTATSKYGTEFGHPPP